MTKNKTDTDQARPEQLKQVPGRHKKLPDRAGGGVGTERAETEGKAGTGGWGTLRESPRRQGNSQVVTRGAEAARAVTETLKRSGRATNTKLWGEERGRAVSNLTQRAEPKAEACRGQCLSGQEWQTKKKRRGGQSRQKRKKKKQEKNKGRTKRKAK